MNPKTKRILLNVLFLALVLLAALLIGYVAYSYLQFGATGLAAEDFRGREYLTYDGEGQFRIGEDGALTFRYRDTDFYAAEPTFSEDVFTAESGEKTLYFYATEDGRTFFCDEYRIFLHKVDE